MSHELVLYSPEYVLANCRIVHAHNAE